MRIKKIDKLLTQGFLPPFFATFFIATFVLNMQFLWKYVDEIVGKGFELRVIFELLFYQALAMVPNALLLATLLASVMVMGNLSERYELASMKSAGIPLLRIMRSLIVLGVLISIASFFFSNNLIPVASLKFKSRLYDIRNQKPTLSLAKGEFNYDFQNFVIHIKDKSDKGGDLQGVKIYDHRRNRGNDSQTNAERGKMYYSEDKRYLIMRLYDGHRYEEVYDQQRESKFPHLRMNFEEYESMFDMQEFEMEQTDEDLFKKHYSLLSMRQLRHAIDSLHERKYQRIEAFLKSAALVYHYRKYNVKTGEIDSVGSFVPPPSAQEKVQVGEVERPFVRNLDDQKWKYYLQRSENSVRNLKKSAQHLVQFIDNNRIDHIEHENELHRKFLYAVACLMFLFIGAPMGAIIRKGGFGWSILIAIIFFMVFYTLQVIGEKLSVNEVAPPFIGMWLPIYVVFPIGLFLTYKAMNDSKLFSLDFWQRLFVRKKKKKAAAGEADGSPPIV